MVEKDAEWILTENVIRKERELSALEIGDEVADGAFSSYKWALAKGLSGSHVERHNAIGRDAKTYGKMAARIIRSNLGREPRSIADIGCGLGHVTNELHNNFPAARVVGYDVSRDGIEYAKKTWRGAEFCCKVIEPSDRNFDEAFDVIHCREFYPFTRTNDADYHMSYLRTFIWSLNPGGIVVIGLADQERCMLKTYQEIIGQVSEQWPRAQVQREMAPILRCYRMIGNYALACLISRFIRMILGKGGFWFITVKL